MIHEAAGDEYFPIDDQNDMDAFKEKMKLERPFFLSVSTLEPRKNYPFLFKVFAQWLAQSKADAQMVVIGKKGWYYDEIFSTVEELKLQDHIRFEGYVAGLDELRYYYNAAEALFMAPIYEGFWLPGLEALACGTPVIAPNHSSITEVVSDGGLLIDSWELDEWVDALNCFWNSRDQENWKERGLAQAAKFSWKKAGEEHLKVYRKVGAA
jgi:glycosyltransferase involved in cell wall biosynthesis